MEAKKSKSKFARVKCSCSNEQNIFMSGSSSVSCLVCGTQLAVPTGGRLRLVEDKAKLVKMLD
jgi:small subunit ribosomal protein S27e